jgi:CheY-like chemotaxis protein
VLWNLFSNAVKFTDRGGRVQVRLARVASHVEIVVSDTGIGIAPQFLPHVFERFRQADAGPGGERGGLGLGLSIARQLVEMHGGTIHASSEGLGHGATFRVRIPLMIVRETPADLSGVFPHAAAEAPHGIGVGELHGVRVLALDDEADALSLLAEALEAAGADVRTATSAGDAMAMLATAPADVVIADLGMPDVDGFMFIERLRGLPDAGVRAVPAAALTAHARSDDRLKALRAGFDIHLAKPIDPAELVTTVAALAKRSALRDGLRQPLR